MALLDVLQSACLAVSASTSIYQMWTILQEVRKSEHNSLLATNTASDISQDTRFAFTRILRSSAQASQSVPSSFYPLCLPRRKCRFANDQQHSFFSPTTTTWDTYVLNWLLKACSWHAVNLSSRQKVSVRFKCMPGVLSV